MRWAWISGGLVVLALHWIAPLGVPPDGWGVSSWRALPAAWRPLLVLVGLTLLVGPGRLRCEGWFARPRLSRAALLCWLVLLGCLFWWLRTEVHWGNYGIVANGASRGSVGLKHALASALAAGGATGLQAFTGGYHGDDAWAALSVLAGCLYVWGAAALGHAAFPHSLVKARVVAALACSAGFMAEFFGVVESYPLALSAQVWTVALLVRFMTRERAGGSARADGGLPLLFMCSTSTAVFVATVYLWPAVIVGWISAGGWRWEGRRLAAQLSAIAAPLVAAGALVVLFGRNWKRLAAAMGGTDGSMWVPLSTSDDPRVHFAMISWEHVVARLELMTLVAPAWLPLLLVCVWPRGALRPATERPDVPRAVLRCLALAAVSAAGFVVLVNPDMGPVLDWMQTGTGVLPIFLLVLVGALTRVDERDAARMGVACVGLSLLHTVPWVLANARVLS